MLRPSPVRENIEVPIAPAFGEIYPFRERRTGYPKSNRWQAATRLTTSSRSGQLKRLN
jgi:hypothetical protein